MFLHGGITNSSSTFSFSELKILYNYNTKDRKCYNLNYYILIIEFYIFRQKKKQRISYL